MARLRDGRVLYAMLALAAATTLCALYFGVSANRGGRDAAIGVAFGAVVLFGERLVNVTDDRDVKDKLDEIVAALTRLEEK